MAIGQKDIKLLWGRSGNRCAICKTELTQRTAYGDALEMLKYERVTPKALPNLIQPTRYTRG